MMNPTQEILSLKKSKNAVILAHTYQPGEVQDIADFVGDSYGLSVKAASVDSDTIIFCGVLFMAETAAILNPGKRVVLAAPDAGCPMADMITADELKKVKNEYPGCQVVCYVNSPAEVKALSDVCVTSSNAVRIVNQLPLNRKILFVPDKHLGSFVAEQTGRDMVMWDGFCPTHVRITEELIAKARKDHPRACIMIHPEAPSAVRALCDTSLSTGQMLSFVKNNAQNEFVVATEQGLMHTLKKENPSKIFHHIGANITCPNMRKGTLEGVLTALNGTGGRLVNVDPALADKAKISLVKMLELGGPVG